MSDMVEKNRLLLQKATLRDDPQKIAVIDSKVVDDESPLPPPPKEEKELVHLNVSGVHYHVAKKI